MSILNLTQHTATAEQIAAGVIEPEDKSIIQELITFNSVASTVDMEERANKLAMPCIEQKCKQAMIGGAPFFMSTLEKVLKQFGIQGMYAFSERVSEDIPQEDGTIKKVAVFKHSGFVYA